MPRGVWRIALTAALALLLAYGAPGETGIPSRARPQRGHADARSSVEAIGSRPVLDLQGPSETVPGEDVDLIVSGVTLAEVEEALERGNLDVTYFPRDGVDVDADYDWLQRQVELEFEADRPGTYLIKLHLVRDGKLERAETTITVRGKPDPEPTPNPYRPPAGDLGRLVEPLKKCELSRQDATAIAKLYAGLAADARTTRVTTAELRASFLERGKSLGVAGKYAGLGETHDRILKDGVGLKVRPATEQDAAVFLAMAWAVWEAGK